MAIFNSYVSLPEGKLMVISWEYHGTFHWIIVMSDWNIMGISWWDINGLICPLTLIGPDGNQDLMNVSGCYWI